MITIQEIAVTIEMFDRKDMINKRLSLTNEEIERYSLDVSKKISELECYKRANLIGVYQPIKNEIKVFLDKTKCYPKVEGDNINFYLPETFEKGSFEILEPVGKLVDKPNIDIIIVPLLACDRFNNRIGYGKGYYDRYLKDYKGITVGVCYDFQLIEDITPKESDVALTYIVRGNL